MVEKKFFEKLQARDVTKGDIAKYLMLNGEDFICLTDKETAYIGDILYQIRVEMRNDFYADIADYLIPKERRESFIQLFDKLWGTTTISKEDVSYVSKCSAIRGLEEIIDTLVAGEPYELALLLWWADEINFYFNSFLHYSMGIHGEQVRVMEESDLEVMRPERKAQFVALWLRRKAGVG